MTAWKAVWGYEGLYEVSDTGVVRSLPRPSTSGGILATASRGGRYLQISLCRNGVCSTKDIHIVVLEAFVGLCPPGMQCRHLDDNKTNNYLSNLVWGTQTENAYDSVRNRTHVQSRKTHCAQGHEYTTENTYKHGSRRDCRTCRKERDRRRYYQAKQRN